MAGLSEVSLEGQTVLYDQSGFGIRYDSAEVTTNTARRLIRGVSALCPNTDWVRRPASDYLDYEGLIWTPWHIADTRSTAAALAERVSLRSVPLWDANQWDSYCGSGHPYLSNPLLSGATPQDTLSLLNRVHTNLRGMRFLDVGCSCGNTMLYFELHGLDSYGIEIDPRFVSNISSLLLDRIVWGDALYALYAFNQDFFDIVRVSCLGYIMRADTSKLLTDIWLVLKPGAVVLLDLPTNSSDLTVHDKVAYGPYVRPSKTYLSVLKSSGFTYVGTFNGLVVATKTHTPNTL